MSIVKISGVRKLHDAVNYISQGSKTNDDLITTFGCDREMIVDDFKDLYEERLNKLRKETKNKAKMIVQSFDLEDNISPETAHKIGIKLADNHLKHKHQYIIATHIDTDYIHNHIIFNQVRTDNLLMYDTTRRNTVDNLRLQNDQLSKEYNLSIPKERSHENKITYISQREEKARKKGNSFKEELENAIDFSIKNCNDYYDFLSKMEELGFKNKQGKHLAFLNEKTNRFMRTKTLGMNYSDNSIKYRIDNKDFEIHNFKYTVKTKKIDKSENKYRENKGLRKWASKQNIIHLQEISHLIFNENKTIKELQEIQHTEEEFNRHLENKVQEKDDIIYDLLKRSTAFDDYLDSASLIDEYKNSENKQEFKSENYEKFKKFDNAKKNIYVLKNKYNVYSSDDLMKLKNSMESERNLLYQQYNKLHKERDKEKRIDNKIR